MCFKRHGNHIWLELLEKIYDWRKARFQQKFAGMGVRCKRGVQPLNKKKKKLGVRCKGKKGREEANLKQVPDIQRWGPG